MVKKKKRKRIIIICWRCFQANCLNKRTQCFQRHSRPALSVNFSCRWAGRTGRSTCPTPRSDSQSVSRRLRSQCRHRRRLHHHRSLATNYRQRTTSTTKSRSRCDVADETSWTVSARFAAPAAAVCRSLYERTFITVHRGPQEGVTIFSTISFVFLHEF